jgi:hypothetical protein
MLWITWLRYRTVINRLRRPRAKSVGALTFAAAVRFHHRQATSYARRHSSSCDRSHWGRTIDRAGQELLLTSHPFGPGSAASSEWQTSAHVYTRGQLMACVRAGLIALVLLGILALIVLF